MTTPDFEEIMPYGVTLIPSSPSGNYLEIDPKAGDRLFGTTGLTVPNGVFTLTIDSTLTGVFNFATTFSDGTEKSIQTAIPEGGRTFSAVMSGENIQYLQFMSYNQQVDLAAGRRATVRITPVPHPV